MSRQIKTKQKQTKLFQAFNNTTLHTLIRIQHIVGVLHIAKSIHRFIRLTCLSVNLELAIFVKARTTEVTTVFPQIRPAGIIFLLGLQLRGLLECGYYSRASIIF